MISRKNIISRAQQAPSTQITNAKSSASGRTANTSSSSNSSNSSGVSGSYNATKTTTTVNASASDPPDEDVWFDKHSLFRDHIEVEVLQKWHQIDDQIWAKIVCMERNRRVAKAYLRAPLINVNSSSIGFDGHRLGLSGFESSVKDEKVTAIKRRVGKGINIAIDDVGDVWLQQVNPQCDVIARPYDELENAMPSTLRNRAFQVFRQADSNNNLAHQVANQKSVASSSKTSQMNKGTKQNADLLNRSKVNPKPQSEILFDLRMFKTNVARLMLNCPNGIGPKERMRLERQCAFSLVFVRESNSMDALRNPLWVLFINIVALDYLRSCFFDPLLNPHLLRSLSMPNPIPLPHASTPHQSRLMLASTRPGHHRSVFSNPPKSSGSSSDHSCESSSGYSGNSSDSLTCNRADVETDKFTSRKSIAHHIPSNGEKVAANFIQQQSQQPPRAKSHPPLRKLIPLDSDNNSNINKSSVNQQTNGSNNCQLLPAKIATETIVYKANKTAATTNVVESKTTRNHCYDDKDQTSDINSNNIKPTTTKTNRLLRLLGARRKCHVAPALPPPRLTAVAITQNKVEVGRRAESVDRLHLLRCVGAPIGPIELKKQTVKFVATKPSPPSSSSSSSTINSNVVAETAAAVMNSQKLVLTDAAKHAQPFMETDPYYSGMKARVMTKFLPPRAKSTPRQQVNNKDQHENLPDMKNVEKLVKQQSGCDLEINDGRSKHQDKQHHLNKKVVKDSKEEKLPLKTNVPKEPTPVAASKEKDSKKVFDKDEKEINNSFKDINKNGYASSTLLAKADYLNRCLASCNYNINKLLIPSHSSFDSGFYSPSSTDSYQASSTFGSGPNSSATDSESGSCNVLSPVTTDNVSGPEYSTFNSVINKKETPQQKLLSKNKNGVFLNDKTAFPVQYWTDHYRKCYSSEILSQWN